MVHPFNSIPASFLIPQSLLSGFDVIDRVLIPRNTSADNNDVSTSVDDLIGRSILLTHSIALNIQPDAWGEDEETFVERAESLLGDKADNEVAVSPGHVEGSLGVGGVSERASGGHLSEKEKTSVEWKANLLKTMNDAVTGKSVCVCEV